MAFIGGLASRGTTVLFSTHNVAEAERYAGRLLALIRALPWAEFLLVALLALEALHRARPWHTGVLGLALLGYLLAVHLAETGGSAGALVVKFPMNKKISVSSRVRNTRKTAVFSWVLTISM